MRTRFHRLRLAERWLRFSALDPEKESPVEMRGWDGMGWNVNDPRKQIELNSAHVKFF
jgi:hypothetical protein